MFGKNGPTLWELARQALSSTQRGYDLLAPKFDATPFRTPDEILTPALRAVGSVDSALDLCCGTGAAMRLLRPMCRRRLVGVDFSSGMLEQAQLQVPAGPDGVRPEWVEADVLDLHHTSEFDLITCFGALGHILPSDQEKFLRIVYDALKPGGRFVLVSGHQPPVLSLQSLVLRTFNGVMCVRNAILKPPFIMYYLTFMLPELKQSLEQTGFAVEVRSGQFHGPFRRYQLVVATRPYPEVRRAGQRPSPGERRQAQNTSCCGPGPPLRRPNRRPEARRFALRMRRSSGTQGGPRRVTRAS